MLDEAPSTVLWKSVSTGRLGSESLEKLQGEEEEGLNQRVAHYEKLMRGDTKQPDDRGKTADEIAIERLLADDG